jgi:hypothetical protein
MLSIKARDASSIEVVFPVWNYGYALIYYSLVWLGTGYALIIHRSKNSSISYEKIIPPIAMDYYRQPKHQKVIYREGVSLAPSTK